MKLLSTKLEKVRISETAKIKNLVAAKESIGEKVLSLSVGEPDFKTPANIIDSAKQALNNGLTKYTSTDGIIKLKETIKTKYTLENHLDYDLDQIIVCSGGKQVIFNAFVSTLNPADEVIIPAPFWVSYPEIVKLCEASPIIVDTKISNDYKLTAAELELAITTKTKWIIINSPSNPTGSVYSPTELSKICEVLKKYPKINILSDDIYEHIIFEKKTFSNIVQIDESFKNRTLLVNGVSKSYAMTGWRIGYGVGAPYLIEAMTTVQSQSTSNATSISQYAAIEAISNSNSFIEKNKKIYQTRRDQMLKIFADSKNIITPKPMGAFYALPSIEPVIGKKTKTGVIINNDIDFTEELLKQTNVAVVPGSAFGSPNSFRISYAVSEKILQKGCSLIIKFLNNLK